MDTTKHKITLDAHFQELLDKFRRKHNAENASAVMRDLLRMWDANDASPSAGSGQATSSSLEGQEVSASAASSLVTDRDSYRDEYRPPDCYVIVDDARVSVTRDSQNDPWLVPLVGIEANAHPKRGLMPLRAQRMIGNAMEMYHVHTRIADNMLQSDSGWEFHDVTSELTEAELADVHETVGDTGYLLWEQGLSFGGVPRKICLDNFIPKA